MNEEGIPILPLLVASLVLCYFGLEVQPAAQQAALDLQRVRSRRERDRRRTRAVGREWRARAARGLEPQLIDLRQAPVARTDFLGAFLSTLLPRVPHGDRRQSTRKSTQPSRVGVSWGPQTLAAPRRGGLWDDRGRTLRPLPAPRFLGRGSTQRSDRSSPIHGRHPL